MNELDNNSQASPQYEADIPIPDEPPPDEPGGSREIHWPGESPPKPGKKKRVPEKFGTWRWWVLFAIGILVFFVLTSVFWVIFGGNAYNEQLGLLCAGPFWLLMNAVVLLVFFLTKLHASIFGYMAGYIVNFFVSLSLSTPDPV